MRDQPLELIQSTSVKDQAPELIQSIFVGIRHVYTGGKSEEYVGFGVLW